jgi:UDP-N-acetylmuramate: L-alanyl-gamma-D-glutamyl-meso-diaminopimelate ligase
MRIHIIGVAGSGMGSLAGLLMELGHEVSGSDVRFDPPMGPALERWGVRCLEGFDPAHLDPAPDLVVVGNVCRSNNPEARAAIDGGLDVTHLPGALQRLVFPGTCSVVIAGTHGKTTTTSLTAWLLDAAGLRPGYLIGGIPFGFERSYRAPQSRALPLATTAGRRGPFVIEGDEYDTAFFEKTAKFLHYRGELAVVTSIEHDHIDIYPDYASYVAAFEAFIASIPEHGLVIANGGDAEVVSVVQRAAKAPISWFGLEGETTTVPIHWLGAIAHTDDELTHFDLYAGGMACGRFETRLSGRHNVRNALAALAVAAQGFGVGLDVLGHPLAQFAGIRRRQELVGERGGVLLYDDFAHHPTAVRETLDGLSARHAGRRVIAVFEPRSATACRNLHQDVYPGAFESADEVVLAPLGRSGLPVDERLDISRLAAALDVAGRPAAEFESTERIVEHLVRTARGGDVIVMLSNGAFDGLKGRLLAGLGRDRQAPSSAPP